MTAPLRFHWRLIQGGDLQGAIAPERLSSAVALPEMAAQIAFCREAEQSGIDSALVDISSAKPDPMVLGMALAASTERLKFMVAHRPGLMSPALFAQQVNTFSTLASGRITLNMVAGYSPAEQLTYGDNAAHDTRYERMKEYLTICDRFWSAEEPVNFSGQHYRIQDGRLRTPFVAPDRSAPEIYVGGGSANAREAASALADCWLRFADTPENVAPQAAAMRLSGTEVGLRLSCIVRPTRREAIAATRGLLDAPAIQRRQGSEASFVKASDAESMRSTYDLGEQEWLTPHLWAGAVQTLGATTIALVGTPDEVVDEIYRFKEAGISQFILHGWPKWEEMRIFCRDVLPLVRQREQMDERGSPPGAELAAVSSQTNGEHGSRRPES
ncbi:MAG: alkanesulfonate monooxygenase [Verrucomicrobia bacterium]|nr:MAG: alkanesulfonate monooxygenase [Verrucomicrobiota bacterium]